LDDPLRVLRSIRFAARLRFTMDEELIRAAIDDRVRTALAQKVSRERVGGEVDLMLRSPDPVGAMRLLINLKLVDTVFPVEKYLPESVDAAEIYAKGLELLTTSHDHLADCRWSPPLWCVNKQQIFGDDETRLNDDIEKRRLLWYASFLKPLYDATKRQDKKTAKRQGRQANRSAIVTLLVDDLKRPIRDAEAIEKILKAADAFTLLLDSGCDISAQMVLLSDARVIYSHHQGGMNGDCNDGKLYCSMNGRSLDPTTEQDPLWEHAMEFRLLCARALRKIGPLWRAALFLAISEQLAAIENTGLEYAIEGDIIDESQEERRLGIIQRFDAFATALQNVGLIGIWNEKPLLDGETVAKVLPNIPRGPAFRDVMDEQVSWMTAHPGAHPSALSQHLKQVFPEFAGGNEEVAGRKPERQSGASKDKA
jgi:hypothetical protein